MPREELCELLPSSSGDGAAGVSEGGMGGGAENCPDAEAECEPGWVALRTANADTGPGPVPSLCRCWMALVSSDSSKEAFKNDPPVPPWGGMSVAWLIADASTDITAGCSAD